MPRPTTLPPDGYAVIRRDDGFYLLRLLGNDLDDDGLTVTWEQFAGPYVRRSEAVRRARREVERKAGRPAKATTTTKGEA